MAGLALFPAPQPAAGLHHLRNRIVGILVSIEVETSMIQLAAAHRHADNPALASI